MPIQVEISGYPISLMMQGLKINCEIYLDPNEFYVNALQITYNEFFMDSNFLVSYITSKLLSESMLSSLVLRAQDELSKIVYRAMYYNEDKIRPILGEWET